jgi:hypothetical protein
MMVLQIRELKYAMSASSCIPPSHRLGILMSGAGRFVSCIDCHLSLSFPAGAHYDTIAKQFESGSCSGGIPSNDDVPCQGTLPMLGKHIATVNV